MDIQELKPKQIELIESLVSGKDTFVFLPTGYGKSVILVKVVTVASRLKATHFQSLLWHNCINGI